MATLKELYTTLKSLRDMNLPVDDKLLKAADNLEEKIIKESGDGSLIRQFLQQHIGLKIEDLSLLDLHNLECFNPLSSLWG